MKKVTLIITVLAINLSSYAIANSSCSTWKKSPSTSTKIVNERAIYIDKYVWYSSIEKTCKEIVEHFVCLNGSHYNLDLAKIKKTWTLSGVYSGGGYTPPPIFQGTPRPREDHSLYCIIGTRSGMYQITLSGSGNNRTANVIYTHWKPNPSSPFYK